MHVRQGEWGHDCRQAYKISPATGRKESVADWAFACPSVLIGPTSTTSCQCRVSTSHYPCTPPTTTLAQSHKAVNCLFYEGAVNLALQLFHYYTHKSRRIRSGPRLKRRG